MKNNRLAFILDKPYILVYTIGSMKKRTNYNLNEEQHQILRIAAAHRGISASKLLRQILDEWIKANDKVIQIQIISDEDSSRRN